MTLTHKTTEPNGETYEIKIAVEEITRQEIPQILANKVSCQRAIKSWSKTKLTEDMRKRDWWFTGAPIVFDQDDQLIDGQHRLEAVLESGKPSATFVVVRGVATDAYVGIDGGVTKSIGDYFKWLEIENALSAAAASRWLYRYEKRKDGMLLHTSEVTRTATHDAYTRYAAEIQSAIKETKRVGGFLGSVAMAAALYIIVGRKHGKEFCSVFFNELSSGVGVGVVAQMHKAIDKDNKLRRKMLPPDFRFASVLEAARVSAEKTGRLLIKPSIQKV